MHTGWQVCHLIIHVKPYPCYLFYLITITILGTNKAVTVAVTTASPAVVGCHRGCVLPPAVVHVTSHTL